MITLGSTYYNNPNYLLKFVERNINFVDEMIIVDDGSSDSILNYITPNKKLRIFRVLKDYGFNSHGCRNLIMKESSNSWNVLMDLDREFLYIEDAFRQIKNTKLNKNTLYRFVAHANMGDSHISVNDYLIHKEHFFSVGGYDEEIIGQRWGDREFFEQLKHFGREKILYGVDIILTRPPSIQINHVSPNDIKPSVRDRQLVFDRIKKPNPNKKILTFEWEEIY